MNSIKLEKIAKILSTRQIARDQYKICREKKIDTLDFKDVVFVSRSFANEWINLEKEHNYKFKKINMNKDVSFMFNHAKKNIDSNVLKNSEYKTVSFDELVAEA